MGQTYYTIKLRRTGRDIQPLGMLPFASLEAACADVLAAIPDTIADILKAGGDPKLGAFLICDTDDRLLRELPFGSVIRG